MKIPQQKRVVVTGLGAVSPLGNSVDSTWHNLIQGVSGIGPIQTFDASDLPTQLAGEVKQFDPTDYLSPKSARRVGRFIQFAVASAKEAVAHANLDLSQEDPTRIGLDVSSALGGVTTIEEQSVLLHERGHRRVNPTLIPATLINMVPAFIAIELNIQGPAVSTVSACTTGLSAIGEAARRIMWGDADVMLAGAAESIITPLAMVGFGRIGALSHRKDPQQAITPFDAHRDGTVIGEGAAVLVLESLEHAQARNAPILAEIAGYAMATDAYHLAAPDPGGQGASRAMRRALDDANIKADDLDYIAAHGTGTPLNDAAETEAVKVALGESAYDVPMSSIKSMTGHMMGASGTLSCVAIVKSILESIVPPTIGLTTPDPTCDLDYVPNTARKMAVNYAMANAFGFGGQNGSLILKRV